MLTETGEHARLRQVRASPESHGQVAWQRWRGAGGGVPWFGEWLAQDLGL